VSFAGGSILIGFAVMLWSLGASILELRASGPGDGRVFMVAYWSVAILACAGIALAVRP
jgi:hypothetical protein